MIFSKRIDVLSLGAFAQAVCLFCRTKNRPLTKFFSGSIQKLYICPACRAELKAKIIELEGLKQ